MTDHPMPTPDRRRASTLGGMVDRPADPTWVTGARVMVIAGKGGVGSSTVAATLALVAARQGADVLLVAVDGKPGMGPLLGGPTLGPKEQVLRRARDGSGRISGRSIPPEQAFQDYLALQGIGGLLRKAASNLSLDMIAASTPGLEHLLVLGKVKELERERVADLIIVDAPPAGHAAPFLRSATAIQDVVASGPLRDQADDVASMLADPQRCQCALVTLPEETPVNEVIELAYDIEERLGLALAPLIVNACWPDLKGLGVSVTTSLRRAGVTAPGVDRAALEASSRFGSARLTMQRDQLSRLDERLPLSRLTLPRLPVARLATEHLEQLADALAREPHPPGASATRRRAST